MNLIVGLNQIKPHSIYFDDPQANIVMSNGEFSRLIFSNMFFSTIGLLASLSFEIDSHTIYFNKHRLYVNNQTNRDVISNLIRLEQIVLANFYKPNKSPVFKLRKQLLSGFIRIYSEERVMCRGHTPLLIKVSGVWCTDEEYGITFKFILPHS